MKRLPLERPANGYEGRLQRDSFASGQGRSALAENFPRYRYIQVANCDSPG